jgi:hypothetical protein
MQRRIADEDERETPECITGHSANHPQNPVILSSLIRLPARTVRAVALCNRTP